MKAFPVKAGRILLGAVLTLSSLFADEVRVTPLEFWRNASLWPEDLSVEPIISASLHASGGENVTGYTRLMNRHIEDLTLFLDVKNVSDEEKGELILQWMHEHILTGRYIYNQTRLDLLLERGDYNCVSSAVLYLILTRSAGLATRGEETRDHAFCTLTLDKGSSVDVETTTLMGFDPGSQKEFSDDFENITGFAYVKPGDYRNRQAVSDKGLIALILQNRMAARQGRGDYAGTVGLAVDRWFFHPTERHGKDMNDAFRNWVSTLNGQGKYEEALDFIIPISEEFGFSHGNADLVATLVYNRVVQLTNRGLPKEAGLFLGDYEAYLTGDSADELHRIIDGAHIEWVIRNGDYDESLNTVRLFKEEGRISPEKGEEWLIRIHQSKGLELFQNRGNITAQSCLSAYRYLNSLPAEERNLAPLRQHRNQYRDNWSVQVHNRFALLANDGKYEEALVILKSGLALFPDDRRLSHDLKTLEGLMKP